ncbi:LOW QUALITY PROTEIN: hypothetical protein MAR_038508 [Mya arenaria]|uniref:Uncharacterized protein n=1 Tax=Mya arenaria TaxID=6604 RepID=A0ABY7FU86_MYAAR|nr:LOW QUALITY PROTEIN: hypothetical protein MAR_038508 [Mya arenaria]
MGSPLKPRNAFFGGHTEGLNLYEETTAAKQIKYYDVASNKTGKIPSGHPQIIEENFKNISNKENLMKYKVLSPRGLYIPVLLVTCNGKLMFSLCRTCSATFQQSRYEPNDIALVIGLRTRSNELYSSDTMFRRYMKFDILRQCPNMIQSHNLMD